MHYIILGFGLLISGATFALPHLDLELSSEEYRAHLQHLTKNKALGPDDPAIAASIKLGDRLSKWIAKINASRPPDAAIRLTSPLTRRGIPIDTPSIYSPTIIKTGSEKILAELPEAMKNCHHYDCRSANYGRY
jgi:hypothetical protein